MIDIYHSRRSNFRKCSYFLPTENRRLDEYVQKSRPQGTFYAKEVNSLSNQQNVVNNAIILDRNMVTLETDDIVNDLVRGSIVLYLNQVWIVDNTQQEVKIKESEFNSEIRATTYISLRR